MFITDNVIAPPSNHNPFYASVLGGDQSPASNVDGNANPCLDEVTRDMASSSPTVQQALRDARDAYDLPSGFPKYDMANTGSFTAESDKLNYDAAALDDKAAALTAHGSMGKVVTITNIADRVRNVNEMMWDKYKSEQATS